MKVNYLILLFICGSFLFSQNRLPVPKDYKLYTEFISYKKFKYLKKESISTGYIAMNGKDKFIYKQLAPFVIEIRKKDNNLYYKRENMNEIIIDITNSSQFDIAIFFNLDDKEFNENFVITKNKINNTDHYNIIPKNNSYVTNITAKGNDYKLEELTIFYKDGSFLRYEFKNTKTGMDIDSNLF
ncbi:MAG TPA: hypothetical protein PLE45_08660 [Spirochaetota bacterium]|nr:hypothetical protein [Spirochaetota bacterium]HOL57192.1 hypothetical protein [Spirochaetota bacterium]HPP04787.1 hypothetical protein [Spirochaetota bacterium]